MNANSEGTKPNDAGQVKSEQSIYDLSIAFHSDLKFPVFETFNTQEKVKKKNLKKYIKN